MEVIIYFERPGEVTLGLCAVKKLSEKFRAVTVMFASGEKSDLIVDGNRISVYACEELGALGFDCLIYCNDSGGGYLEQLQQYVPCDKIFTPKEFVQKFAGKAWSLLFVTYANAKYHIFATLYPLFALMSNPNASVEIFISDYEQFDKIYRNVINFYREAYPGKVRYTPVQVSNVLANSVRFLIQPTTTADYVYIGDIDIFLLDENILDYHLNFMQRHQSDFSNVLRNEHSLTGLHFIPFDKMYPINPPPNIDLARINDEVLLCLMMREKNLRFPVDAGMSERKIHGIHISYFSRPPLTTMTTFDKFVEFPSWGPLEGVQKYLSVRYSAPVKEFIACLNPYQIELRRLIQLVDMWAFFVQAHPEVLLA